MVLVETVKVVVLATEVGGGIWWKLAGGVITAVGALRKRLGVAGDLVEMLRVGDLVMAVVGDLVETRRGWFWQETQGGGFGKITKKEEVVPLRPQLHKSKLPFCSPTAYRQRGQQNNQQNSFGGQKQCIWRGNNQGGNNAFGGNNQNTKQCIWQNQPNANNGFEGTTKIETMHLAEIIKIPTTHLAESQNQNRNNGFGGNNTFGERTKMEITKWTKKKNCIRSNCNRPNCWFHTEA